MPIGVITNVLAVIIGGIIGTMIGPRISERFKNGLNTIFGICAMTMGVSSIALMENMPAVILSVIVLFCASGTGIYGSIVSGMTGDHSILLAKSILDLPTALIFACALGGVVSFIALPQLLIFLLMFFLAGVIYPFCSPTVINDFKACGGVLLLATGFRMIKVKEFPIADMIPAMLLVMPVSHLWVTYVLPVVAG